MTDLDDWRNLDLAPGGRSLIEASAGTGKTWTIGVLYLRLLLERDLSPRQIVVATFTNAAAFEVVKTSAAASRPLYLAMTGAAACSAAASR